MLTDIYKPIETEILDVIEETSLIKTFVLKPKEPISFKTGQFIELTLPGIGEAPFTPSSNPKIKEKMDVTIMNAGRVTKILHGSKPKAIVGLRGPFGKGYPIDDFAGKEIFIVGGGVGLAPLRSLLYALFNNLDMYKKVVLKYGAKTPKDIAYKKEINTWAKGEKVTVDITVDVGDETWTGRVGLVTKLLDGLTVDFTNSVAIVCGPPIMMKFATFKLLDLGFKAEQLYLSMEKNMSCGLGKCGHCRLGNYYCCKDGPVFTYDKIKDYPNIWD